MLSCISPRGTASPMFVSLVADVSMVMVGARGLAGPLLLSSAIMVALRSAVALGDVKG
jgi:hypothetical protein